MKYLVLLICTLWLTNTSPAASDASAAREKPVEFSATYIADGVALKGDLSDPAWQKAPEYTGFLRRTKKPPLSQTYVKILYDDKNIYFGVRMEEPNVSQMQRKFDQHDLPIFSDDAFEVVFDTRGRPETFYHFVVNAIGGVYDSRNGDKNWSSTNVASRANVTKNEWTVELAIPFEDLTIATPVFGETWGLRLCRERKAVNEDSALPATTFALFTRNDLARLTFQNDPNARTALRAETKAEHVQWGLNRIPVFVKNTSTEEVEAKVSAQVLDQASTVIDQYEKKVKIPANGESEVILEIPITSDLFDLVSVTLSEAAGKPIWGRLLKPGFPTASPRLAKFEEALAGFEWDLKLLTRSKKAVHESLRQPINTMSEKVAQFRDSVTKAIAKGITSPQQDWDTLKGEMAQFTTWQQSRDFMLWEVDPWVNSASSNTPEAIPDAPPTLNFRQAGNEREAVAIEVAGLLLEGRKDLRFVVSDIKQGGDSHSFVSRDQFHIYHAPLIRDGFGRLINDPLIEAANHAFTLTPGKTEKFWIVFDSRGVPPGKYKGVITIKPVDVASSDRAGWKQIPFHITVDPFTLPETDEWPLDAFFFGPGITPSNEPEMLRLFHEAHINWMMTNRFLYMWEPTEDGTEWLRDPERKIPQQLYYNPDRITANDFFLQEAKRRKMKLIFGWNATRNLDWFKEMRAHLRELGFSDEEVVYQGMGDEFLAASIPKHMAFHRELAKQDPKVRFMATLTSVPPPDGATPEQLEEPAKFIDIWIATMSKVWPPEKQEAQETSLFMRERNRTLWAYVCRNQMANWPINDYYRLTPWRAHLAGLKGVAMWTAMASRGDAFDHADGYDEGIFYRGLNKAPIPTKRFEAFREGLEDVAYMAILKSELEKARALQPERDFSGEQRLIWETPLKIESAPETADIAAWRTQAADAIIRLQAVANP